MALRNRKAEETTELKGVNLADEEADVPLGQFISLQNFVPANVYSIKKKRGVSALSTSVQSLTGPSAC